MPLISKIGRRHWKVRFLLLVITAFLWLGVGLHLFPVYWSFITSLKEPWETYCFPPTWWPQKVNFLSYKVLFLVGTGGMKLNPFLGIHYSLWVYLKNTFIIVAGTMAVQIPVCVMVAYALSKLHSPLWNRLLFLYIIGPMLVPMVANLIPSFLLIAHFPFATKNIPNIPFTDIKFPYISLRNTYWAIILPAGYSAFNTLLLKGFFDAIPDEMINAGRLDGASELGIIRRIILPLSRPVLAVISYFTFSAAYASFLWPFIVLREGKWPLSVYMYHLQLELSTAFLPSGTTKEETVWRVGGGAQNYAAQGFGPNTIMALSIIQSIPVFIMFIIFREQLMKGIKLRGFR